MTADYFCGKCADSFGAVKFCFEFRLEFGANLSQKMTCEVKFTIFKIVKQASYLTTSTSRSSNLTPP